MMDTTYRRLPDGTGLSSATPIEPVPVSPLCASIPSAFLDRATMCRALEHNWNSYGALPVDPQTIERAAPFNDRLSALGMSPWLTPMNDGGVALERSGTDDYMLEFCPDGSVSFFCEGLSDEAAMAVLETIAPFMKAAQAIETRRAETLGSVEDESAVRRMRPHPTLIQKDPAIDLL